jgi:molybdopterin synthase catalytic subunit
LYRLTREPIEAGAPGLAELVRGDDCGAVALFYGVVRNHSEGRDVERLEYEAHESMALRKMREAADETRRRFPAVREVGVWHRVGTLEIGEASLLVAVSSPHRKEAFEACHWAVDRVKETVPVWKKEHWAGGSAWVEGHTVEEPQAAPH